jgi:hypothetical protein
VSRRSRFSSRSRRARLSDCERGLSILDTQAARPVKRPHVMLPRINHLPSRSTWRENCTFFPESAAPVCQLSGVSVQTLHQDLQCAFGKLCRSQASPSRLCSVWPAALANAPGWRWRLPRAHEVANLLYEVNPNDRPVIFSTFTAAVTATALLASWLPVRRAAGIDPKVTLRDE